MHIHVCVYTTYMCKCVGEVHCRCVCVCVSVEYNYPHPHMSLSLSLSSTAPIGGTPSVYRKTNVKKSISKLFGSNIRFQKSLRPYVNFNTHTTSNTHPFLFSLPIFSLSLSPSLPPPPPPPPLSLPPLPAVECTSPHWCTVMTVES